MSYDRRAFLKVTATSGLGLALASLADEAQARFLWFGSDKGEGRDPHRANFSFVHLTDQHLYDKRHGNEGYRQCIRSIRTLKENPQFVVMGGDMVFDGCYNSKPDYLRWLGQFKSITDELEMPWYPCMGNHDPFGLHPRRKTEPDDPDIGKQLIQDALNWPNTYYSFDHQGWHFAILDCIHPVMTDEGPSYVPKIGPEQLEWLSYDLGAAGERPKVVVTHIAVFYLKNQADGDLNAKAVHPSMVLQDNKALRLVLERHKVNVCLQGHCHHAEEFAYRDVRYITTASGSGAWWSGDWTGDPPGYTVFQCKGTELIWKRKTYDWEPKLEPNDNLERERQAEFDQQEAEQQRLLELERAGKTVPA